MKALLLALACAVLTACGGGGGAPTHDENPQEVMRQHAEDYCHMKGGLLGLQVLPPGSEFSGPRAVMMVGCNDGTRQAGTFNVDTGEFQPVKSEM